MSDRISLDREAFGVLIERGYKYRAMVIEAIAVLERIGLSGPAAARRTMLAEIDAEYSVPGIKEQT